MYATVITERERQLGFVLGEMPHPKSQYLAEPEIVSAVLFRLDENNVVAKVIDPVGGYRYYHKHRLDDGWITVSNVEVDPQEAILKTREYLSSHKTTEIC
ncbi:MAG: hypothetical protein KKG02_10695 [Candidatus Edwardsbacteria bacterium]|nr:hypothetical protein [Candidatus Edwardsbacteria bacterium]MBU2594992.1 hypothetical protein [Candidatus Edwardsbacteria bacterium]